MGMHVVESAVPGDVAPAFMRVDPHFSSWPPYHLIGVPGGREETIIHPACQCSYAGMILGQEIKCTFIQSAFGVDCYMTGNGLLFKIVADFSETLGVLIVVLPLEIIEPHRP